MTANPLILKLSPHTKQKCGFFYLFKELDDNYIN